MSSKSLHDIRGVLRGLYVIKQNANMLVNQRPSSATSLRTLTDTQRQDYKTKQEILAYERELEMEEQKIMEDVMKQEQVKQEVVLDIHEPKKTLSDYHQSIESEAGQSTFGKGQHQEETVYKEDTPFFMRQDRPKFSTQERYVPSNAASRAMHFGMLGVQLMGGTMAEAIKQKTGYSKALGDQKGMAGYAINEKNAERLANNFKKMRGGALKIGQIMSASEESVLPPVIREAMEKARSEADIMPLKQVTKNLIREYGKDWQTNFNEINLYPFAAASIGQVHEAIIKDGMRVALKMQYTGIANSIDSDLNNFKRIIDMLGIFPRGLYLNEAIDVARGELHWECNYLREAEYQRAYRNHLLSYPKDFYCPLVIDHLSTRSILCTEFIDGREIDTYMTDTQEVRDRIGSLLISLCFKELFEFKMMQTDPNPANYLFDKNKNIMNLLDLGAGRDFEDGFLDSYMQIIWGAKESDREAILHHSHQIGFLTGDENKEMLNAQYTGTMIVGEPFRSEEGELYDFGSQGLTEKVYKILPTLSKHRLTPPPEEIYSLHKKIIGTYLMCIKLRSRVPARQILEETFNNWKKLYGPQYYAKQ